MYIELESNKYRSENWGSRAVDILNDEDTNYELVPEFQKKAYNKNYILWISILLSLSSLQFGYTEVKASLTLSTYGIMFHFNPYDEVWMIISAPIGGLIGSLFTGIMAEYGKRRSIHLANIFHLIGCSISLICSYWIIVLGFFVIGIGVGIHITLCPLAIKEQVPTEVTGAYVCLVPIGICLGLLICSLLCLTLPTDITAHTAKNHYSWRLINALPIVYSALQSLLILLFLKHETPKFYIQKSLPEKAEAVLGMVFIYAPRIQKEMKELEFCNDRGGKFRGEVTFGELLTIEHRKALLIGILVAIFEQLSGINTITSTSVQLFAVHRRSQVREGILASIYLGIAFLFSASLAVLLILKWGRRPILILCNILMIPLMLGIAIVETSTYWPEFELIILRTLAISFVSVFCFSYGMVIWVYTSEILPIKGFSIVMVVHQLLTFIIQYISIKAMAYYQLHTMFYIFFVCLIISLFFVYYGIKETKGQNEREIKYLFCPKGYASFHHDTLLDL